MNSNDFNSILASLEGVVILREAEVKLASLLGRQPHGNLSKFIFESSVMSLLESVNPGCTRKDLLYLDLKLALSFSMINDCYPVTWLGCEAPTTNQVTVENLPFLSFHETVARDAGLNVSTDAQ